MSPQEFLIYKENVQSVGIKGQDSVFRGHRYLNGWGVPQDLIEAVKHYTEAARVKNAEGMFNLASCYHHGRGVQTDIEKALRIYEEVAEMPDKSPGQTTSLGFSVGVASAQHALGLLYEEGIGVHKKFSETAVWYKRAMENGLGNAANNLAILYANGKGVPNSDEIAEMCWRQAVDLQDVNAPNSLVNHYLRQMEPDKALSMYRIGREMGNQTLLNTPQDGFLKIINGLKDAVRGVEAEVVQFELDNKLETKGMTFKQRLSRRNQHMDPTLEKIRSVLEYNPSAYLSEHGNWGGKAQGLTFQVIQEIEEKALSGSKSARDIMETLGYFYTILHLLEMDIEYTTVQKNDLIDLLYNIAIGESHLLGWPKILHEKMCQVVTNLLEENGETEGELDEKVRFCYAAFNLTGLLSSSDMLAVKLLREGIRRYPQNIHYKKQLTSHLGHKKLYEEGKRVAEEGLKQASEDVDLLYFLAVHLRMGADDMKECVEIYKKFQSVAPRDHRKVPESYYQLSNVYLTEYLKSGTESWLDLTRSSFNLGQEAEKSQLPCYLPYGESNVKRRVEVHLSLKSGSSKINPTLKLKPATDEHKCILERKGYLSSPARKCTILQHRKNLKVAAKLTSRITETRPPKLKQKVSQKMFGVEPITLVEMNPTDDHIFENRVLELTIVDDPNPHFSSIHLVAEDDNGDVTRLYIYNVDKTPQNLDNYRAGCRIGIVNPYMRIGAQSVTNGIRNDEPRCIVHLEKVENMCRFCGREDAPRKCSKCKRPYCSRECQRMDWRLFKHKLICDLEI